MNATAPINVGGTDRLPVRKAFIFDSFMLCNLTFLLS